MASTDLHQGMRATKLTESAHSIRAISRAIIDLATTDIRPKCCDA